MSAAQLKCTLCETPIPAGSLECPNCGFQVDASAAVAAPAPAPAPTPAPKPAPKPADPKPNLLEDLDFITTKGRSLDDDDEPEDDGGFKITNKAGQKVDWKKAKQPAVPRQKVLGIILICSLLLLGVAWLAMGRGSGAAETTDDDAPMQTAPPTSTPPSPVQPSKPAPAGVPAPRPQDPDPGLGGDSAIGE